MTRLRLRINRSRQLSTSMKYLPLALLAFVLVVPIGVHAESYTRTLPSSAVNKYALEQKRLQTAKQCYDLRLSIYDTKEACQTALSEASSNNSTIDACGVITKTTYQYTFSNPVCADSVSAYGLTLVAGTAATTGAAGGGATQGATGGGITKGATGGGGGAQTLKNPLKFDSLPELISGILNGVVQLGAILLVLMLVWVGFLFVTAQGNPEKVSTARSALLWTVIGGLILLGAEAIAKVVEATVGSITS